MARNYCTVGDIKRILRTASKKVLFSDSYKDLRYDRSNVGTVRLSAVDFKNTYAGNERFVLTFSDATNYEVEGEVAGYLGVGQIDALYSGAFFEIKDSYWSGVPVENDQVSFVSDSHMSTEDAQAFIQDHSRYIASVLESTFGDATAYIPWEVDYSVSIPESLQYACKYLTAYYIYLTIYSGAILEDSAITGFKKTGTSAIERWIKNRDTEFLQGVPRWQTEQQFFKLE